MTRRLKILLLNFGFLMLLCDAKAYANWVPTLLNSSEIIYKDGVYTFKLSMNLKCNSEKHHDGLTDCMRKSLRSELTERGKGWPVNSQIVYEWSLFVPKTFNFKKHNLMVGQLGIGTSLTEGFRLNSEEGYTYSTTVCFGPEKFGQWNNMRLKLRLSDEELNFQQRKNKEGKGIFEIWCNDKLVYESNGRSNAPKNSYAKFKMGLYLYRYSESSKLPNDIEIKVRGLKVRRW